LLTYFQNHWEIISDWVRASQSEARLAQINKIDSVVSEISTSTAPTKVFHNSAPRDVALRLYGITKWSSENNIDIIIHIHFNDIPRKNAKKPGDYSGFAIYVPTSKYGNSSTTRAIASKIYQSLSKYNRVSDLPGESTGLVDESELIAIGANNTSDAASMLIEYGYIYEPQFQDPYTRSEAIRHLALQTYLGLQDFFEENNGQLTVISPNSSLR
jgi:N-acetylmuramoyl-L-alanine amidase